MTDTATPTERVMRPRFTAALVLLTVAIAAAIGGIALDRFMLLSARPDRGRGRGPAFGQGSMRGREPSTDMRRRFSERMAKDLGLTPEQQVRVDSIMSKQERGIRRVTDAAQPSIDSLTREAQQAMDSILSPAQRLKVKELRGRGRGRGRPPMGDESPPSRPPR